MTFDTIAFTQDELDNALNLCCTSIGLCDNDFILPQIAGVTYISIGEISAKAKFKKDDMKKHNINCIGFVPQFAPQICEHSPSVSSYITSYNKLFIIIHHLGTIIICHKLCNRQWVYIYKRLRN